MKHEEETEPLGWRIGQTRPVNRSSSRSKALPKLRLVQDRPRHPWRPVCGGNVLLPLALLSLLLLSGCGQAGGEPTDTGTPPSARASHLPSPPADFPPTRFESIRPVPFGLFVVTYSGPEDGRPW